MAVSV